MLAKGQVVINKQFSKLFKISEIDEQHYYGFNALDKEQKLDKISTNDCFEITQHSPLLKLLCGNELIRLNVSELFFQEDGDKADYIGVTKRTLYRFKIRRENM